MSAHRYSDYLSKLGVCVHEPRSWSVSIDPNQFWFGHASPSVRFHTTQDRVWLDGVEAKKRLIRQRQCPFVTITPAPEFGGRGDFDLWVSNGHHTLAAYLVLGMKPYVRCFARMGGPHACRVNPPRFDPTAAWRLY